MFVTVLAVKVLLDPPLSEEQAVQSFRDVAPAERAAERMALQRRELRALWDRPRHSSSVTTTQ